MNFDTRTIIDIAKFDQSEKTAIVFTVFSEEVD